MATAEAAPGTNTHLCAGTFYIIYFHFLSALTVTISCGFLLCYTLSYQLIYRADIFWYSGLKE